MPRRYHGPGAGSTNGRRADRATERVLGEALAVLEQVYADAHARGGARHAGAAVADAAARLIAEARASRARTAALLAARVARLEREARRARER